MQAQREAAIRNQDAVYFRKGFLNVHIRKSDRRDDAIEGLIGKRQRFADTMQICSLWKSFSCDYQLTLVDIKSGDFIRRCNTPGNQILP
jgi:hypothetical protein